MSPAHSRHRHAENLLPIKSKMTLLWLSLLLAGVTVAHSGLKYITVDGTTYVTDLVTERYTYLYSYPPFDSRIDNFLGPVRRIEWSHDVPIIPWAPITNVSDPGIACKCLFTSRQHMLKQRGQRKPRPPLLKATARAGADVTFHWTDIVRMHFGPVIAVSQIQPNSDDRGITQSIIVSRRTAKPKYKTSRR